MLHCISPWLHSCTPLYYSRTLVHVIVWIYNGHQDVLLGLEGIGGGGGGGGGSGSGGGVHISMRDGVHGVASNAFELRRWVCPQSLNGV
eukprot:1148367-Pelagomonas_calceolata.AAC.3